MSVSKERPSNIKEKSNCVTTNDDDSSVETLLSDWDDDSDVDDKHPRKKGLSRRKQLEKKFALRGEILERIGKGKNDAHIKMLREHEELVRAEAFRLLDQDEKENSQKDEKLTRDSKTPVATTPTKENGKEDYSHTTTSKNENDEGNHTDTRRSISFFTRFKHLMLFETCLGLPAFLSIAFYCSGHLAFYEVVYCIMGEISRNCNISYDWVCVAAIFLSLLLLRISGGLWEWSSLENHAMAKFELHNRIRLGYWDAKLHLWFRKRRRLKLIIQFASLYMCCAGIGHMQYLILVPFTADRTWILEQLPSKDHGINTPVTLWLQGLYTEPCDNHTGAEMQECRLYDRLTMEDEVAVHEMISSVAYARMFGDNKAHVLSPLANEVIYICLTSISFFFMHKLGAQVYD
mmetsp:Transcript_13638/g.20762  ORF Transcript_13638/g.20762 Transcript_13638/m.20762 type:complete len:404 (-) Transcript_13638:53-1264(-)